MGAYVCIGSHVFVYGVVTAPSTFSRMTALIFSSYVVLHTLCIHL